MRCALMAIAMCLTGTTLAGAREPVWTCAYPGFSGDTVIVTFAQQGNVLKEGVDKYVILENNDVGIVAARSFSYVEEEGGYAPGVNLGAFVIVIDKTTMRFRRGNVLIGDTEAASSNGECKVD